MSDISMSDAELLKYAIENGIIDKGSLQKTIEMNERKKYLEEHAYRIWQGSNKKFYTYLPDESYSRGKRLVKRSTIASIEDAIVEFYKSVKDEPYLEDVFKEWISYKLDYGEIQKQTRDRYETDFDRFFKDSRISNVKFKMITEDMLEEFIRSTIHEKHLTAKAWSGLRTLINGIFKYGKKNGYTNLSITSFMGDLDLSQRIFEKKVKDDSEYVFTKEEERKITDQINSEKESLLGLGILLEFETGLRSGELSALQWTDIKDGKISVTKTEIRYKDDDKNYVFEVRNFPKTDAGIRKIFLTPKAKEIIERIRKLSGNNEYIFFKSGKRIRGKLFTSKLYRICDKVGIAERSMHKGRMTYGTKLLDGNVPDRIVILQMGHKDIRTTQKHYHYNNKKEQEAQEFVINALD